jgi:hypothetical protein
MIILVANLSSIKSEDQQKHEAEQGQDEVGGTQTAVVDEFLVLDQLVRLSEHIGPAVPAVEADLYGR